MTTARITFYECRQASQDYGSDDEHMVSRVFFNLEVNGQTHDNLYVDVKQTVGTDFETASLEIGTPTGYGGPFNDEAFHSEVEQYYRSLVGAQGTSIRITGGATNISMRNSVFRKQVTVEFEVSEDGKTW